MRSVLLISVGGIAFAAGEVDIHQHLSLLQTAATSMRQLPGESEAAASPAEEAADSPEESEAVPEEHSLADEPEEDACGTAASEIAARAQLIREQQETLKESKAAMKQLRQMMKKQEQDLVKAQTHSQTCEIADPGVGPVKKGKATCGKGSVEIRLPGNPFFTQVYLPESNPVGKSDPVRVPVDKPWTRKEERDNWMKFWGSSTTVEEGEENLKKRMGLEKIPDPTTPDGCEVWTRRYWQRSSYIFSPNGGDISTASMENNHGISTAKRFARCLPVAAPAPETEHYIPNLDTVFCKLKDVQEPVDCPKGTTKIGGYGSNAGYGIGTHREFTKISECKKMCEGNAKCKSFRWTVPGVYNNNRGLCTVSALADPYRNIAGNPGLKLDDWYNYHVKHGALCLLQRAYNESATWRAANR